MTNSCLYRTQRDLQFPGDLFLRISFEIRFFNQYTLFITKPVQDIFNPISSTLTALLICTEFPICTLLSNDWFFSCC